MISVENHSYLLNTDHTSYAFTILETGHLEHLHYGKRVHLDTLAMIEKKMYAPGYTINYSQEHKEIALESLCLEVSSLGKGDIRQPLIELEFADGSRTCDFLFDHDEIDHSKKELKTLPSSNATEGVDHLTVVLKERYHEVYLELNYYIFEKEDIITKQINVINRGDEKVIIHRILSNQLDFQNNDYEFTTFTGGWAREMKKNTIPVINGIIENGSISGYSSNHANPFVMISRKRCLQNSGECYGMNLIYSGNHIETVEKNAFQKIRFLQGIHPTQFRFVLEKGETFEAPEAVMSYSSEGFNELSHHFHQFINDHIVRGKWQHTPSPVLLNSWEAAYFDINENKLIHLAKKAKETGIELFVMDDGWFGERNNDTSSLGDWYVNQSKFPKGLKGLSNKIHELGMLFGIWVEPEMISCDSNLYRAHPSWALSIPDQEHSEGRNQRTLDLCNPEVVDYIIEAMSQVFQDSSCDYVKWDMNRMISDAYSPYLKANQQGEVYHRQIIGFYKIAKELNERFPEILFEGCSSGGNRFDLGILCYFPQIWSSDDTDALVRAEIQNNLSYGYPLSVMGAHVSSVPNHQTLRKTELNTRFNIACFGTLGYEYNFADLNQDTLDEIKKQIEFYKEWREVFQYGTFYRNREFEDGYTGVLEAASSNIIEWNAVSPDQNQSVAMVFQKLVIPNTQFEYVKPQGLLEDVQYHFYNSKLKFDIFNFGDLINTAAPVHVKQNSQLHHVISKFIKMDSEVEDYVIYGDTLMNHGINLKQGFCGQGYNDQTRYFQDFGSRMYLIEKKEG